jgi:hypothetical protein
MIHYLDKALDDRNGDGVIDLGATNRAIYGVRQLFYLGKSGEKFAYATVKGETLPAEPLPTTDPEPPRIDGPAVDLGANGLSGWADGDVGPANVSRGGKLVTPSKPMASLAIHDVRAENVEHLVSPKDYTVSVDTLTVERVDVGFRKRGVYARKAGHVEIRDAVFRMVGVNTSVSGIPEGVMIGAKVDGRDDAMTSRLERVVVEGVMSSHKEYENGDGFMFEAGPGPHYLKDCVARRCVDAAIDCKAKQTVLDNFIAEECSLGVKLWAPGHHKKITVLNPKKQGSGKGKAISALTLLGPSDKTQFIEITIDELHIEDDGKTWHIVLPKGRVKLTVLKSNVKRADLRIKDPLKRLVLEWPE